VNDSLDEEADVTDQTHQGLPFGVALPPRPPRHALDELLAVDHDAAHEVEVGIPMRDGVELAADVFLPPIDERPAPAVVIGTPYDKSSPFDPVEPWQEAGYVAVVYDSRGRGKSEGVWHPHERDGLDGHDVVEWAAAQAWCDGKVGIAGFSYPGWIVWATIAERPPHLTAAISTSPEGRWQEEIPYTFGCLQGPYFAMWFSLVRRRILDQGRKFAELVEMLPVDAMGEVIDAVGPGWRETMEHDTLDELWRGRRWEGEYDFDVPCLQVGGWHDHDCLLSTVYHYEEMMARSPARDRQWLLMGPWCHTSCRHPSDEFDGVVYPEAGLDMQAIHLRFFDRFLRGEKNGVDDEPRVRIYDTGDLTWKTRDEWGAGTEGAAWFLGAGGGLDRSAGEDGEASYEYDPMKPNGISFDVGGPWELPLHLGDLEAQSGVISWTSPPLENDLTVRGWGAIDLWAATDGDDTEWHAKLADVDLEGSSVLVAWGCLRASYGEDATDPRPVVPGEAREYSIELTPSFRTFRAGHRIRVILASSEFPWFARNMNRFGPLAIQSEPRIARNSVFFGKKRPSRLRLQVE
jgi:uncharacterized protein